MNPIIKKTLIATLVLAAAAAAVWTASSSKKETTGAQYALVAITRGDLEEAVTAQGKLEAKQYVDVGTQVSGQLKKLHVDFGADVKKGDLIAEIDPQIYQSRLEADEAHLKTLQAQALQQQALVEQAKQKRDRAATLIKEKAVSQEAFDDAVTTLKTAEAQALALKAQAEEQQSTLDGDKTNLSYTKIYAPMDGTIVSESVKEGQTVNASQSAPVIVQIADLDTMTVRAQVAEADIPRLKQGMPAYFTTLGAHDRKWEGKVRQILPSPEVINDVVLYNVLIDVDNKDRQLMTGMSAQVFFVIGSAKNALLVPVPALGRRLQKEDNTEGEAYRVRVMESGKVQDKIVHIGLMDRTHAEIKAGLKEGDQVASTAAKTAPAGAAAKRPLGGPHL